MLSPESRVVMVSGANRGIGLAVARCLHAKGYRLSLGGRDAEKIEAALGGLDPSRVINVAFDARDRASCAAWVERTGSHFVSDETTFKRFMSYDEDKSQARRFLASATQGRQGEVLGAYQRGNGILTLMYIRTKNVRSVRSIIPSLVVCLFVFRC